jgi:hypothetical protein
MLKQAVIRLSVTAVLAVVAAGAFALAGVPAMGEELGWKQRPMRVGDGKGGWTYRTCEYRFVHKAGGNAVRAFGLATMDNGEVIMLASWSQPVGGERPVIAWSKDNGDTWSDWVVAPENAGGRPMMLAYLGKGNLMFQSGIRYFSHDYGRTWPETVPQQPAMNGGGWGPEGNPHVDYDQNGDAKAIAEIGWNYASGQQWPKDPALGFFRWSYDGGKTWVDEVHPKQWEWDDTFNGKTYHRGVSEGSVVRAKNGWLVAALRTDMPSRYLDVPSDDSLEGTGISISKDNGKTWSKINVLYDAGRHHAHLMRLKNGWLVMTMIVRDDVRDGKLASYLRGCDAMISKDNGVTWDIKKRYVLDEFEWFDGATWYNGETGHLYSCILPDGRILTAYGKYKTNGVSLIRWKP